MQSLSRQIKRFNGTFVWNTATKNFQFVTLTRWQKTTNFIKRFGSEFINQQYCEGVQLAAQKRLKETQKNRNYVKQ